MNEALMMEALRKEKIHKSRITGKNIIIITQLIESKKVSFDGEFYSIAKKPNKMKNIKVIHEGIEFDSLKERDRYCELKMLQDKGLISGLKEHPKYHLLDKLKWNGQTLRSRVYELDFEYIEDGKRVVEDVKSEFTRKDQKYKLKRHLFIQKYPDIEFREVIM